MHYVRGVTQGEDACRIRTLPPVQVWALARNFALNSRYLLKEKEDLTDYSQDIELVFVELPKFTKPLEELETIADKWLYFLRSANTLKNIPSTMGNVSAIHHAFEVAKQSKLTRKELDVLEKQAMFLHDNRNALLKAQQIGEQQGMQQGMELGMKEKAREIARSLLDVLDAQTISQKTGLTLEEVQGLR